MLLVQDSLIPPDSFASAMPRMALRPELRETARGALVAIVGREAGVIIAEYLVAVTVVRQGSVFEELPQPSWTAEGKVEKEAPPLEAELLPVEQEWQIVPARV